MTEPNTGKGTTHVSLREITGGNIRAILALRVTDEQKSVYPRSNAYSIAEGHHPPDDDAVWMRAIYAAEYPVGFIMTSEVPTRGEYFLWRLMVDSGSQGLGYGARAVELLLERIEATPNAKVLLTSHVEGDGDAGRFYQKIGFTYTGEILGDGDRLMRLRFPRRPRV